MKNHRTGKIVSFFSALVLATSGLTQSFSVYADETDSPAVIDLSYKRFDLQEIIDAGDILKNACLIENNEEEVLKCYQKIFRLFQEYGSAYTLASLSKDAYGEYEEYLYEAGIYLDVSIAIADALYSPFFESQYTQMFDETIPSSMKLFVFTIHDTPNISILDNSKQTDMVKEYQDLCKSFNNGLISIEDFELQSAQIYIDLTKLKIEQLQTVSPGADYEDSFFISYGRDYSNEEVEKYKENVKATCSYIYKYAVSTLINTASKFNEDDKYRILFGKEEDCDFLNDVLMKYGTEISGDISYSAQYILDNNLLIEGTPQGIIGGYTTFLYNQNVPLIFINGNSSRDSFRMTIHEFGHFNSFLKSDLTELYPNSVSPNIDISEVQSQGMEILFWNYYDDIYGEYSSLVKAYALYQTAQTFMLGFLTNDFESEAVRNIDNITPEELLVLFHKTQAEYGLEQSAQTPFGAISNYMLQPFYCLSYSMSLLPLWELIEENNTDKAQAVEKYNNFSNVNALDSRSRFLSALSESGFGNILDPEYIDSIRTICADYADSIDGILNGDLNNDGVLSAEDLLILKNIFLEENDSEKYNLKQADINRDGKLTASDLAELVFRLTSLQ